MKILNINSNYFASSVHENFKQTVISKGIDFFNYVPLPKKDVPIHWREIILDNKTIVSFCYNYYKRFIFHLKHWSILKDIIKKVNIDQFHFIHSHSLFSNGYIAYRLNQSYNIPYVVTVRSTDVNLFCKKMIHLKKMGIEILSNASFVVFLSKAYRDYILNEYLPHDLINLISKKSVVIPSGINSFWFDHLGFAKCLKKNDNINLLHVGHINSNKNLNTTVKAIDILIDKGYKIKYTAVGRIFDRKVFAKVNRKKYFNHIEHVSKEELLDIYKKNDIFIMPSRSEAFGLVYPEAMSQGLPVIYTRGQGFDKHFDEGVIGYSVQANNAEEIAQRILDIVNNYELISKNCIEKVLKFQWDDIGLQYKKLYEKVVNS